MKKTLSVILVITLLFSLAACKSGAVKSVEEAIEKIGTVSLDSDSTISNVEKMYADLSEDEQKQVSNYDLLVKARESYKVLHDEDIAKRTEAAAERFKKDFNIVGYINAIKDLMSESDTKTQETQSQLIKSIENLCYPGTHFIQLEYLLVMDPSFNYTGGKVSYTTSGKTYNAPLAVLTDYRDNPLKMYKYSTMSGVNDYRAYAYFNSSDASTLWDKTIDLYNKALSPFSSSKRTVDWGWSDNKGDSYYVYVDDLGNKLYKKMVSGSGIWMLELLIQ